MSAPDLSEIGNAGREDEWLFNYVYDGRVYNPETVMPPWGTHGVFNDQEIDDMVAFLKTLKSPAPFKTALDDPDEAARRRSRSATISIRSKIPACGRSTRRRRSGSSGARTGFSCNTCHSDPQAQFKTWAATMPKWEPRLDKVLGVEEFVTRHAKATTGADWLMETDENNAMSVYLHNLANGEPIKVDTTSASAKGCDRARQGAVQRKLGQLNFACTDCHGIAANKWIRGQWLGEPKGQFDHFPTWRTSLQTIWDIRQRFQWCQVNIRADELPPDAKEYGDLEFYLASQNHGLKMSVPGIRH